MTISPRLKCTSSRASARWRRTTRRWASSSSSASRRRRAACPRSKSPSTSTRTASCTSRRRTRRTGATQSMTITGGSSLSKEEIDRMVRDAEAHAEEDRQRRAEAEVRNNADGLVYQTEKLLKDQAEKFQGTRARRRRGCIDFIEGSPRGHRHRGHQGRDREAAHDEPGLQPAPLRRGGEGQHRPSRQHHRATMTTSLTPRSLTNRE